MTMTVATTFVIVNAAAVDVALASACLKAVSVAFSIRMALVQARILSVSPLKTTCWPHYSQYGGFFSRSIVQVLRGGGGRI